MATLTVRIPEGVKAEIETLLYEIGLWNNQSDFVREAIESQIKKYWNGERLEH